MNTKNKNILIYIVGLVLKDILLYVYVYALHNHLGTHVCSEEVLVIFITEHIL